MPNLKSFDPLFHGNIVHHESVDVPTQMAVENGLKKFLHFAFFTLNLQFDSTVNQVLHRSDYVIPGRDRFNRKTETNTLYASFV